MPPDLPERNHEGNWDVQQQGGSQKHLGTEARVPTLPVCRGRGGDADRLGPVVSSARACSSMLVSPRGRNSFERMFLSSSFLS